MDEQYDRAIARYIALCHHKEYAAFSTGTGPILRTCALSRLNNYLYFYIKINSHDHATADSIAAFLAAGLRYPGDAVTILGSTLAVKMLSRTRADEPSLGIYSQRLGQLWIAGDHTSSESQAL